MIIAVLNQKGGVGKTTTTLNLGAALAAAGAQVLLCDLDLQRDLIAYESTLKEVSARADSASTPSFAASDAATLSKTLRDFAHHSSPNPHHGFALLDCPPILGEETAAALKACDIALIPVAAEFPAVRGLARVLETIAAAKKVNRKLQTKILVTMLDRRSDHGPTVLAAVRAIPGVSTFETVIPRSLLFAKAAAAGESIFSYAPRSPGAQAYRELASEVLKLKK